MTETAFMVLSFIGGFLLGTVFFGGLWFTVKRAVDAPLPALWVFISFILRMGIALFGFYFISAGDWQKLVVCLFGFIVSRFLVIFLTKRYDEEQKQLKKEDNHEA